MNKASPISPPARAAEPPALPWKKTLYRIDEAAEALSISDAQVRALLDSGELVAVMINSCVDPEPKRKHVRVAAASIAAFIARRTEA